MYYNCFFVFCLFACFREEIKLCIIIEFPAGIGTLFAGFCSQAKWTPRLSWVPMYPLIPSWKLSPEKISIKKEQYRPVSSFPRHFCLKENLDRIGPEIIARCSWFLDSNRHGTGICLPDFMESAERGRRRYYAHWAQWAWTWLPTWR